MCVGVCLFFSHFLLKISFILDYWKVGFNYVKLFNICDLSFVSFVLIHFILVYFFFSLIGFLLFECLN